MIPARCIGVRLRPNVSVYVAEGAPYGERHGE